VTSGPAGTNEPLIRGRGLQGLATSGPVVLFDDNASLVSLVVSPMDNFKNAVHHVRAGIPLAWETGVSSELSALPIGFEHRTLLVAGSGITVRGGCDRGPAFTAAINAVAVTRHLPTHRMHFISRASRAAGYDGTLGSSNTSSAQDRPCLLSE
jgi:hypothetical protein